jgi:LPXTG-motif cell wall-anchored protein
MIDFIMDNYWTFTLIMIVLLLGLIGVFLFLRNRREEED